MFKEIVTQPLKAVGPEKVSFTVYLFLQKGMSLQYIARRCC